MVVLKKTPETLLEGNYPIATVNGCLKDHIQFCYFSLDFKFPWVEMMLFKSHILSGL